MSDDAWLDDYNAAVAERDRLVFDPNSTRDERLKASSNVTCEIYRAFGKLWVETTPPPPPPLRWWQRVGQWALGGEW